MPTLDWLKKEFYYGYSSGNVLSWLPGITRWREERKIGGSYRNVFLKAILPYINPNSTVLELGAGRGSWTRAMLEYIPKGELHTVDFQDLTKWLKPEKYSGRLICHKVDDNAFSCVKDDYFDFFWSFGVLCHNNVDSIRQILQNALPKMKVGGIAVHEYGNWDKLDSYGWGKGNIPVEFKNMPDNKIWWPRNSKEIMTSISRDAGWTVLCGDLELVKRDSIIVLKKL